MPKVLCEAIMCKHNSENRPGTTGKCVSIEPITIKADKEKICSSCGNDSEELKCGNFIWDEEKEKLIWG